MSVTIKTAREIELMREAGRLLEKVHDELALLLSRESVLWILTGLEKN